MELSGRGMQQNHHDRVLQSPSSVHVFPQPFTEILYNNRHRWFRGKGPLKFNIGRVVAIIPPEVEDVDRQAY